jgi:hypothetical protein
MQPLYAYTWKQQLMIFTQLRLLEKSSEQLILSSMKETPKPFEWQPTIS